MLVVLGFILVSSLFGFSVLVTMASDPFPPFFLVQTHSLYVWPGQHHLFLFLSLVVPKYETHINALEIVFFFISNKVRSYIYFFELCK